MVLSGEAEPEPFLRVELYTDGGLPLNAICSRIGRGVTGRPSTGGQNHAYERRDFAPYGYCY